MPAYTAIDVNKLPPGIYIVQTYQPMKRDNNIVYLITAIHEDEEDKNNHVYFWANKTLTNYIKDKKPREEFRIFVNMKVTVEKDSHSDSIIIHELVELTKWLTK
jgi:uncharacterized protein YukJ